MPYMGAALTALAMGWSTQAIAQDQFKDLDPKHWAYEAVTELQQKGILLGYPDGYFKGKRTLTRYEFAIALKRALDKIGTITGPAGPPGANGAPGPQGDPGPPGMTPEEVANLRRLTDEFRNELASLGANIRDINNRLDALAKDIAAINARLDKMVHWSGSVYVGAETTRSRSTFVDYSGAVRINPTTATGGTNTILGPATVINDAQLRASANLGGGGVAVVDLDASNYLAYRGSNLESAQANPAIGGATGLAETVVPLEAYYHGPIGGEHSGTEITVGRFKDSGTALTYQKPTLDAYLDVPGFDDGKYIEDGAKISAKLGSVKLNVSVASFASVTDQAGNSFNKPLFGGSPIGLAGATVGNGILGGIPFGINVLGGQQAASQTADVHVALPLFNAGELGLGVRMLSTNLPAGSPLQLDPAATFTDAEIYDVHLKLNPLGRIMVYAEAAKSVTSNGLSNSDPSSPNDDNNAYTLHLGYASGPISVKLGYNYIDPNYGAPGDWLKLGNWTDPTDIEGGFLKINYKLSDTLAFNIGGDLLEGARNRPGYLQIGDRINRAKAGLSYKIGNSVTLSADYEGVFYDFASTDAIPSVAGTKPNEQFITLGAGLHLSGTTVLQLGYQIISYNSAATGVPLSLSGAPGLVGFDPSTLGTGSSSNAGVFTTQLSVKF
jgi:hypothetical protein